MTSQYYSLEHVRGHFSFTTSNLTYILKTLVTWREFNVRYVTAYITSNSIGFTARDIENDGIEPLVLARIGMRQQQECCHHRYNDDGIKEIKMDISQLLQAFSDFEETDITCCIIIEDADETDSSHNTKVTLHIHEVRETKFIGTYHHQASSSIIKHH